jgi:hypothetical protein
VAFESAAITDRAGGRWHAFSEREWWHFGGERDGIQQTRADDLRMTCKLHVVQHTGPVSSTW